MITATMACKPWKGWGWCVFCNEAAEGGGDYCSHYCATSYHETVTAPNMEPRYRHDCDACVYLGRFTNDVGSRDLYWCKSRSHPNLDSVIRRYGNDGREYTSYHPPEAFAGTPEQHLEAFGEWYAVALMRAAQRGLYTSAHRQSEEAL